MALPITIPNTFANATTSIPLANLDANFTTVANAINGIGNGSEALANVNITGGNVNAVTMNLVTISSGNAVFTDANATNSTITNFSSSNVTITGGTATLTTANATNLISSNVNLTGGTVNVGNITGTSVTTSNAVITGGTYSNIVANNTNRELVTINANGAANTINYDAKTQQILLYTGNATANVTINIRGDSGTTLNNTISNNQSLTVVFGMTNNATARYVSLTQIDGSNVTPKWQGGAPTSGTANSTEVYVYNVIKTGANTYTVLASKTAFT